MQIEGHLSPVEMRQYTEPIIMALEYRDIVLDPFPTPQEATVTFPLESGDQHAFVPLRIVNQDERTVVATLIGEMEGNVFVTFPPTNFGRTQFFAVKEDLEAIAVKRL